MRTIIVYYIRSSSSSILCNVFKYIVNINFICICDNLKESLSDAFHAELRIHYEGCVPCTKKVTWLQKVREIINYSQIKRICINQYLLTLPLKILSIYTIHDLHKQSRHAIQRYQIKYMHPKSVQQTSIQEYCDTHETHIHPLPSEQKKTPHRKSTRNKSLNQNHRQTRCPPPRAPDKLQPANPRALCLGCISLAWRALQIHANRDYGGGRSRPIDRSIGGPRRAVVLVGIKPPVYTERPWRLAPWRTRHELRISAGASIYRESLDPLSVMMYVRLAPEDRVSPCMREWWGFFFSNCEIGACRTQFCASRIWEIFLSGLAFVCFYSRSRDGGGFLWHGIPVFHIINHTGFSRIRGTIKSSNESNLLCIQLSVRGIFI